MNTIYYFANTTAPQAANPIVPANPSIPIAPITAPPTHGDSLFWTIVAIAILVKTLLQSSQK